MAGMKIVNQYKRPVPNRVEKDRNAYSDKNLHRKDNLLIHVYHRSLLKISYLFLHFPVIYTTKDTIFVNV